MEKALESSADIIVWIDADVLIMRHDEDIAGHLLPLGWYRGNEQYHGARPGAGSAYLQHTSVLPLGWNQTYLGPMRTERTERYVGRPSVEDPHAVHFLGMGVAARKAAMAAYAATMEQCHG
jgi:hypothetical protein